MPAFKLKKYKKEFNFSYTIGAFPTVELLKNKPREALDVYTHSKLTNCNIFEDLWPDKPVICDDKAFARTGVSDNSYVLGVFKKYESAIEPNNAHVVLVNPGDMGNLGTIIRTLLGFGYKNLAIIKPAADIFDPKTIRASMGAVFHMNFTYYDSFDEYMRSFPEHRLFPFMTSAVNNLASLCCIKPKPYSLIFGSETSGLDESFLTVGTPVKILQSKDVDSLNLAIAVAVGAYYFADINGILPDSP